MTLQAYYGEAPPHLQQVMQDLLDVIKEYPVRETLDSVNPILYCKSRIKEPQSMIRKLKSKGLPTDSQTALTKTHDAAGIRVVCSFLDDVYAVSQWLHTKDTFAVIAEKDYIAYPKPNGYRSLRLIAAVPNGPEKGIQAEIQPRTIAIDFWAALEHQIKYKRHINYEKTIRDELKRCADEIASVDVSMQTIRDILQNNG